jgi:chorismate mutase/prephenate dehydratase
LKKTNVLFIKYLSKFFIILKVELIIQGIKGSYSYQAALIFLKELKKVGIKNVKIKSANSFDELFDNFKDFAVVPVENSLIGSIYNNYKRILENSFYILASLNLKIKHALLSKNNDLAKIKKVYSHPAALEQCKSFIDNFNLIPIKFSDTASAALFVSKNKRNDIAAIASPICAKLYNLKILKKNIQDEKNNFTRFFLISKKKVFLKSKGKILTPFLFELEDKPAALFKALMPFATYNVNLTKIESIINPKKPFSYDFILEAEINKNNKVFLELIKELKVFVKKLIIGNSFGDLGFRK